MTNNYDVFIIIVTNIIKIYIQTTNNVNINNIELFNHIYFFYFKIKKIFLEHNYKITLNDAIFIFKHLAKNHDILVKLFDGKINDEMSGGFFYNEFDSVYTKILNILDIFIDIISVVPTNNVFPVEFISPFQIISMVNNLARGEYFLGFMSFISLIPGIGNIIGAGSKIIYKFSNYIYDRSIVNKQIDKLDDLENMRNIYKLSNFNVSHNYVNENLENIANEKLLI